MPMHHASLAFVLALAGCARTGPIPPPRESPPMPEAPFVLGTMLDASASELVVGIPDGTDIFASWQLRHLDGDQLIDLPGASAGAVEGFRVVALDRIVLRVPYGVARYDGAVVTEIPIASAPPVEERGVIASDTRASTGETFLVMSAQFASDALYCHGVDALVCAPLAGVASPERASVVATDAHVYVAVERYGQSARVVEVDASGVAHDLVGLGSVLARAGSDRVLARGATTIVLADDGTREDLGAGRFEALGPSGDIVRLDVSSAFLGYDCPRGLTCTTTREDVQGYVQWVLFRREAAGWIEHAHVDIIDEAVDDAVLAMLPDRRIALTARGSARTFLGPALP